MAASANQLVIFGMRADPEPNYAVPSFDAKRTMMETDARGIEATDLLEPQGRMTRILLQ
jgi:hypothetical protein